MTPIATTRNWLFNQKYGLIDVHQRYWDEPAGNGGFLYNGGRAYIDMGHFEYCTPECKDLLDITRYSRAGDFILQEWVDTNKYNDSVRYIRNNIDHFSGATFGCHENYLVRRKAPLTESNVHSLLAYLTVREVFAGAGRIGAINSSTDYQISQRADYINNDLFEWVSFNSAIINTRDEPLADARKYRRLHLLHGDTHVLPTAQLLTLGVTALVLDLLEADEMPKITLDNAVQTFRQLSHQPDGPWEVRLAGGTTTTAVDILWKFHEAATMAFGNRDQETKDLLRIFGDTLSDLVRNPRNLIGKLDWITKRYLLEEFCDREHLGWDSPWVKSQDLAYHMIDPKVGVGMVMENTPDCWKIPQGDILDALMTPPQNTRAKARSDIMKNLDLSKGYYIDWEVIGAEGEQSIHLLDPLCSDSKPKSSS